MPDEAYYISKCKALIEEKLCWGNSNDWQNQDFENLSAKIFEETKVLLSSSTLKRIWGKVRYESTPNLTTLNALAQFASNQNWREFISNNSLETKAIITIKPVFQFPLRNLLFIAGFIFLISFIGFKLLKKNTTKLRFENIKFTSNPVTLGLPNTIIFHYDASNSNADSVFIQQSWDSRKRFKVDKQLHEYTCTYYFPGYYSAKLILNDSIVKEHDIFIETDGWVGMIEQHPVPIYLPKNLFKTQLGITQKDLSKLKIDFQKEAEAPIFSLTKVDKNIRLMSDNFSLQVQLQNTYNENNAICQHTNVLIFGTDGIINIPLCKIGCVGEAKLMLGMKYIDGKTNDLSGFGVDFSKIVKLNCESKNQLIKLYVNDKVVYVGDFKQNIGRIVGAQIRFNGTGFIKDFELKKCD